MLIDDLRKTIYKLYLPWHRRLREVLGEANVRPIVKWVGLVFLVIIEFLLALLCLAGLSSNARIISDEAQKVTALQKKIDNIGSSYKTLQSKTAVAENLLESLSSSRLNSKFLERVTLWAGLNQVTIEGINFLPPRTPNQTGLLERPIEITALGEYGRLLTLVETIGSQESATVVTSLEFSLNEKKKGDGKIENKI